MATRSLTDVFILMRNNALQNRHLFSDQVSKDTSKPTDTDKLLAQGSTTPTTPEVVSHHAEYQNLQNDFCRIRVSH